MSFPRQLLSPNSPAPPQSTNPRAPSALLMDFRAQDARRSWGGPAAERAQLFPCPKSNPLQTLLPTWLRRPERGPGALKQRQGQSQVPWPSDCGLARVTAPGPNPVPSFPWFPSAPRGGPVTDLQRLTHFGGRRGKPLGVYLKQEVPPPAQGPPSGRLQPLIS